MVAEPQEDLISLYEELVGDRDLSVIGTEVHATLPASVAEVFGRLEAQKKAWRPGRIILPHVNRPFDVAIAFQNGRLNYVRPESLAPGVRLDDRMTKLGFNGQLVFKHPVEGHDAQLVVLLSDPEATPETERRFAETLREFCVRFSPHDSAGQFATEAEQMSHARR